MQVSVKIDKKITDFTEISIFSRKEANFTENVTAVKSWIRLVPKNAQPITHDMA